MAFYHGEDINAAVGRQKQTTADDVRRMAGEMFNHTPSATLIYMPR